MSLPIYYGEGAVRLKEEFVNEFKEKVCKIFGFEKENLREFERIYNQIMLNESGLLQFVNHTCKPIIDEFVDMVKENVDKIIDGQFWFTSNDDDGPKPEGFPFQILIEVCNGKVYIQTWLRHLPIEFDACVKDDDWFENVYNQIFTYREERRKEDMERWKNETKTVKTKDVDCDRDNDLPF